MGGDAFLTAHADGHQRLNTKRMSREDYWRLKAQYTVALSHCLPDAIIECLKEAPDKQDYGDIDFLIASDDTPNWIDLANALGAKGVIDRGSPRSHLCSVAVRLDGTPASSGVIQYFNCNGKKPDSQRTVVLTDEVYAQLDIHIIPQSLFEWHLFYSSYSDMAGLLGYILTRLGFTVSDKGLILRLQELDDSKKVTHVNIPDKEGMLFLSRDPDKIMQFLGLSIEEYQHGFATLDDFYTWLGKCRLLFSLTLEHVSKRTHERQREQKRHVFARFFNEWLPAHPECFADPSGATSSHETIKNDGSGHEPTAAQRKRLRAAVCAQALDFFDKRAEYDTLYSAIVRRRNNENAAHLLRPILLKVTGKDEKYVTVVLRAFKRNVGVRNHELLVLHEAHTDLESELFNLLDDAGQALRAPEKVEQFAAQHWKEIRSLEKHKDDMSQRVAGMQLQDRLYR